MPRRKRTIEGSEPVSSEVQPSEPAAEVALEPVTTEPVTTEPVTTEPVILEPVALEPVALEPVTTEPQPNDHYKGSGKTYEPDDIKQNMMDKLNGKIDSPVEDPFSQSGHLEKEIKGISEREGFTLTRGKEAGARLMARRQQKFGRQ